MKQKGPSCSAAAFQTLSQTQTGLETPSPSSGTGRREVWGEITQVHGAGKGEGFVGQASNAKTYDVTAC